MKLYAGIDLHSSNNYLGIIDEHDKRVYGKRLPNCINTIRLALEPFCKKITGIAVESTYNWYWLVDSLQNEGYKMHLANPSAIQQYEGLKHTDDKWDSYWLAHMYSAARIYLPERTTCDQESDAQKNEVCKPTNIPCIKHSKHVNPTFGVTAQCQRDQKTQTDRCRQSV